MIRTDLKRPVPAQARGFDARFVAPLALGATLNPINSTMIATAMVPIAEDFHIPVSEAGWLIAGLYLASAVAQPAMGRFADLFGPRRVYLVALTLVALAGIIGELARNILWLVAARVVLGIGTSAAYPSSMRLFRQRADQLGAPPPRTAMGVLSLAALSTSALGPLLGGLLTESLGWHAIFGVNIPLAAITAFFVMRWIPKGEPGGARFVAVVRELDPVGTILFAAALVTFLLWLLKTSGLGLWPLVASIVLWPMFVVHSLKHARPFIDVRMLMRNLPLSITYLRAGTLMMIVYCIVYGFAQWLESGAGYTTAQTGLIMLPVAIVSAVSSLVGARTRGIRVPFIVSIASAFVGSMCLLALHSGSPVWMIVTASLFFGLPQGLFSTSTQAAVYVQARADEIGTAAGLQRAAQYIGAIGAGTILSLLYGERASDMGLHGLAWVMGGLCAVLLAATVLDRTIPRGRIG